MTFEEALASIVNEDENYQKVKDEGLTGTLDPFIWAWFWLKYLCWP